MLQIQSEQCTFLFLGNVDPKQRSFSVGHWDSPMPAERNQGRNMAFAAVVNFENALNH